MTFYYSYSPLQKKPSTVPCAQYTVLLTRHSAVYRAATTRIRHSHPRPCPRPSAAARVGAGLQRHPATISSHIVSSHLISSHRIPSQRIPSHPVTSICAQVVGDGRVRGHPGAGDDGAAATGLAPHPPAPQGHRLYSRSFPWSKRKLAARFSSLSHAMKACGEQCRV